MALIPWFVRRKKTVNQMPVLICDTDSYSGAVLFVAFLAEMRQPFDFWKGMIIAQTFICVIYTVFGATVSSHRCVLDCKS